MPSTSAGPPARRRSRRPRPPRASSARACRARATGTSASSTPARGARSPARPASRSNELAEGFVKKGQKLRVQACRFRGSASSADLSIGFVAIAERSIGKVQIVDVATATRKEKQRLQSLGLDLTEHGDAQLRRGRPARHRRRAQAARRRLHLRRPDRRSRGALEGRQDGRREVRGVEPQDPAPQRQQRSTAISPTTTSSSSSWPCAIRGSSRS